MMRSVEEEGEEEGATNDEGASMLVDLSRSQSEERGRRRTGGRAEAGQSAVAHAHHYTVLVISHSVCVKFCYQVVHFGICFLKDCSLKYVPALCCTFLHVH